jgi:hypothetical protein
MKIDVLYPFHFDGGELNSAIGRLRTSIMSLKDQNVRICICDTSGFSIARHIKDLCERSGYYHQPTFKPFSKSLTINVGVRHLIRTRYFILSDIDLVYQPDYVERMMSYVNRKPPVRVIPMNYNHALYMYGSGYDEYKNTLEDNPDPIRSYYGIAPGNGLIHTPSFMNICGYNEDYIGYGPEDAEFNLRISQINTYIEDKELETIHINHSFAGGNDQANQYLYRNLKYRIEHAKNESEMWPLLISNNGRWGVL